MFIPKGIYFKPSTDDASGGNPPATPPATDAGKEKPANDPNSGKIVFDSEEKLQEEIERRLKERLEREKRKTETAAQKAREEAEAAALAKNEEWQKLAEKHQGKVGELEKRLAELEPFQQKAERYEQALKTHLETQRAGLPAHILALLDKLDTAEQLEYIAANREVLQISSSPNPTKPPSQGVPPTPPPADKKELSAEERDRAQAQVTRSYQSMF